MEPMLPPQAAKARATELSIQIRFNIRKSAARRDVTNILIIVEPPTMGLSLALTCYVRKVGWLASSENPYVGSRMSRPASLWARYTLRTSTSSELQVVTVGAVLAATAPRKRFLARRIPESIGTAAPTAADDHGRRLIVSIG